MKRNYYVLVFCVLSFIVGLTSCNNEQTADNTQRERNFDRDLNLYVASQESIINGIGHTRADGNLTYDDLVAMAEKLDSTSKAFYKAHPEVKLRIKENPSKEELEIMSMDADSLLAFVNRNFSPEVENIVRANLNAQPYNFSDNISTGINMSNSDKTLQANLKLSREFTDVVDASLNPNKTVANSPEACKKSYIRRLNNCQQSFYITVALTTVGGIAASPSGVALAVTYASYCYAVLELENCRNDAYSSYQECLK